MENQSKTASCKSNKFLSCDAKMKGNIHAKPHLSLHLIDTKENCSAKNIGMGLYPFPVFFSLVYSVYELLIVFLSYNVT